MSIPRLAALMTVLVTLAAPLHAAVHVTVLDEQTEAAEGGTRVIQPLDIASENAHYTLVYDVIRNERTPGEVTSHWWQWQQGYITIGMTEPSRPNWYWQGFVRWTFDDESLHERPARMRVIRGSGQDGMVEFAWDTPLVRASLRFAMASGSDKLLMFARWEPKVEIERNVMQLSCYPATFAQPRNRRVTTALGTREPGATIDLDTQRECWVLYEDVTEGRPAQGSAGLLVGTPGAFAGITIPVGEYGIVTTLEMAPQAQSCALGLYDFPTLPDYEQTREYFSRGADAEAAQIGRMAAGDLDEPLPPMPIDEQREAALMGMGRDMLDRPAELWRPDPQPLNFPWAAQLPGEPVRTGIFCRRWAAWETMELARRLEMDAEHLYFDTQTQLVNSRSWPYQSTTGIGPLPQGVAARRAAELASDEEMDLYLVAGVHGSALPGVARAAIMERVADGAGLLIAGHGVLDGWDEALFADLDYGLAESVLDGFSWEHIPGYRDVDRGRVEGEPPVLVYRYGDGRVVHLNVNLNRYSTLVPRNDASEGLQAATDHCLAIAAQAALTAVGRELPMSAPTAESLLWRVQDDLGRVIALREQPGARPDAGGILPLPTGREYYSDVIYRNADGETIGLSNVVMEREERQGPRITDIEISPATVTHEPAPPMVNMPEGGEIECTAALRDLGVDAFVRWEVRDAFDRLVARQTTRVNAGDEAASVTLELPGPVTVCHRLDVALVDGDRELSFARRRFTMAMDYPTDDFTALVWTYAGGDPVLRRTDRMCYEWGADMCDLCHMGGYTDAGAAREYAVSARSGLRPVPYVTRIAGSANEDHERVPCLHDPAYIASEREKLATTCRQAAPYSPAAYTLGDENYLFRGGEECCHSHESVAAYRAWLADRYGLIEALNEAWAADYASFEDINRPMLLSEVAEQTQSLAPWIDHKRFMDTAFANAHERAAGFVRAQDPGARVGWDGLLGYTWRAGYDFTKLTANLELNETYTLQWLQGELVRSFKREDALTGKWGNRVADTEQGWHSFPWDCLVQGDNSVWWWTSWGCDYIPFNPDLSQSNFGRWFFEAVRETTSGPGKLLLQAGRRHSPIAVLYSQRDLFAAEAAAQMVQNQPFADDGAFLHEHEALLRAIRDLGHQATHVSPEQLEAGIAPDEYRLLVLPLAGCLSDRHAEAIRDYVEAGGTLLEDGRAGMLSGEGRVREVRPLDDVLGVTGEAGMDGFTREVVSGPAIISGGVAGVAPQVDAFETQVLEPGLRLAGGTALGEVEGAPVMVVNAPGEGRAVTLNMPVEPYNGRRDDEGPVPLHEVIAAVIASAGVTPPATVTRTDGPRPMCLQQVLFGDGPARYLAVQQDILVRGLGEQRLHIALPEPAVVYDMRAGEQIGDGPVAEWDATIERGWPLVYSLLPSEVEAVELTQPGEVARGETAQIDVAVRVSGGEPDAHVVRLDVYAPGSDMPHRQYSSNVLTGGTPGMATIPFALNDERGTWRLVARDVASGVTAGAELTVQ